MATHNSISRDVVADAIANPIDWARFEELAYAVLVADDFPKLRKLGGVSDQGADAQDESFYDGQRKISTVIQVTSARAQTAKVKNTLKRLKEAGIKPSTLVFFTRHPVSSEAKRKISEEAEDEGVTIDVRDDQYLIAQLSKPSSPLFSRFFGTAAEQFQNLLSRTDPLASTSDRLQHALLASLGAFVLSSRARIARNTLFDKTVVAVVAAAGGRAARDAVLQGLAQLFPLEAIDRPRLDAALSRLVGDASCTLNGDEVVCSEKLLYQLAKAAKDAEVGYQSLVAHIINACQKIRVLDDAVVGYIERNLRRAILHLLRASGPLRAEGDLSTVAQSADPGELRATVAKDLPADIAHCCLVAFSGFTRNSAQAASLAPLVRSYSALAIRNVDPAGRRWQQNTLSRSCIALDTDAVLHLVVEELPEHHALLRALQGLAREGVELQVSEHVLDEAAGHIGRAHTTFNRFADTLLRLPGAVVDAKVWHAVVRGYYYASKNGFQGAPVTYMSRYFDAERPVEYLEHILSRRVKLKKVSLTEVPPSAFDAKQELEAAVLEYRERARKKAQFRDPAEMAARVRDDVSMALTLAERSAGELAAPAKGYLATEDRAFWFMSGHPAWGERPSVAMATSAVPELSSFVAGTELTEDEAVRLLFNPVAIAAAEQMAEDISVLASIGVDLREVPLERLDWDLKHQLRDRLDSLKNAVSEAEEEEDAASAEAALGAAKAAAGAGYRLAGPVATLVGSFDALKKSVGLERQRREQLEDQLRALADAARQTSGKGRRRINRILVELGIELPLPEEGAQESSK